MVNNPGGFWIRVGAILLDGFIIGVPISVLTMLLTGNIEENVISNLLIALYTLVVPIVWNGYTVGKRIVGVRIVNMNGSQVGIGAMLLRTIVAGLVYSITLGVGLIVSACMVGLREDKRGLHDVIAGTYVTKNPPGH